MYLPGSPCMQSASLPTAVSTITRSQLPAAGDSSTVIILTGPRERAHQLPALGRVPTTVQEVTITTGIQYHPLITSTPELESDALNYSALYPVRWRNKI